jgi:hypothetical protein
MKESREKTEKTFPLFLTEVVNQYLKGQKFCQ